MRVRYPAEVLPCDYPGMEAVFVTERIILLTSPEDVSDNVYRPAIKQTSVQLQNDYQDHYMVMNVSDPRADLIRLNRNVVDFGWPANLAPPLERLCSMCKQAEIWMNNDRQKNVLVIHCKGGLGRAAVMIASYMHYSSICATPSQALDRYAMKRFFDEELKKHILPSQRRYVQYFSGLLTGSIRICSDPVYLHSITLLQVPNFDGKAGCRPCFKIYQAQDHLWTSDVYSLSESDGRRILCVELRPALQLRGDILIKCLHQRRLRPVANPKDIVFRCQLHTCALIVKDAPVVLNKCDLDEASTDIRFPEDGRLELGFSLSQWSVTSEQPGRFSSEESNASLISNPDRVPYNHSGSFSYNPAVAGRTGFDSGPSYWSSSEEERLARDPVYADIPILTSLRSKDNDQVSVQDRQPDYIRQPPESGPPIASYGEYAVVTKKSQRREIPRTGTDVLDGFPSSARSGLSFPDKDSGSIRFGENDKELSESLDSGISAAAVSSGSPPKPSVASWNLPPPPPEPAKMERRTVSPGGTLKSVKFRDENGGRGGLEDQENRRPAVPVSNGGLRNGMDVVDLDSFQPDMEELDRVFESLQAESDDLDKHLSSASSTLKSTKPPSSSPGPLRVVTQKPQTPVSPRPTEYISPRPTEHISPRPTEYEGPTSPHPQSASDSEHGLITGYVPQDRKNLAKKYGAFTFGLPTGKPELKSINSPPPVRRSASKDEELYDRTRLRKVEASSSLDRDQERRKAEEKLYSSAAPADSAGRKKDQVQSDAESDYGTYGKITPRSASGGAGGGKSWGASGSSSQSRSLERERGTDGSRSRSPSGHRPRTPTEDERLLRLLNVDQGEFLVSDNEEPVKGRLKEIAREGQTEEYTTSSLRSDRKTPPPVSYGTSERKTQRSQTSESHQTTRDVNMESESVQTDPEDSPSLDRRKKKKTSSVEGQGLEYNAIVSPRNLTGQDASSWLQRQHDKLMQRRHGPEYSRSKDRHSALLEELKSNQERMIQQVANRDEAENKVPLSSVLLREVKTPPLERRNQIGHGGDNGYAVVKKVNQTTSYMSSSTGYKPEKAHSERIQGHSNSSYKPEVRELQNSKVVNGGRPMVTSSVTHHREHSGQRSYGGRSGGGHGETVTDTDHDSIVDEVDFSDEPLYKAPPTGGNQRASRSREVDERRMGDRDGAQMSHSSPTSPDLLRRAAPSPKSILKNPSLHRPRKSISEERGQNGDEEGDPATREHSLIRRPRATTPSFPVSSSLERSRNDSNTRDHSRSSSLQRHGYNIYGPRERTGTSSGRSTPTGYYGLSGRRSSLNTIENSNLNDDSEEFVIHHHPIFVKDLSKFWYKPGITREEAIEILKDKPAGSFLIRDSHSYPGSFGLAIKVDSSQLPAGAHGGRGKSEELVRHFLVEPSPKGVYLKGCQNEPVFGSLPALVYQHSITPLALPCKLLLPESDLTVMHQPLYSEDSLQRLMDQGAACNVSYLMTIDTESLTGPQAVRRAMDVVSEGGGVQRGRSATVHFKVNAQGVLLTDVDRKLFFRRHYPIQNVSYCGLDPDDRRWTKENSLAGQRCFGFVSRKRGSRNQNECHVFAELDPEQPAAAVVSFVNKVMMTSNSPPNNMRAPSVGSDGFRNGQDIVP